MNKMSMSEMITYATVLIRCEYSNGVTGSGTGFIMNLCQTEDGKCFPVLITNNHVVENSIKTVFEFCRADDNGNPVDTEPFSFTYDGNGWVHHPNPEIDLCCLPIGQALNQLASNHIRIFYIPLTTDIVPKDNIINDLFAMEEIVMVGYPIGLSDWYNHKPIIRRGITATHPKKDYQGKKEILVDMACFPGSSGSPVFILNEGSYHTPNGVFVGNRVYLLGVLYGGPQYNAQGTLTFNNLPNQVRPVVQIPTNLGIIIKAERILEFEKLFRQEEKPNG